MKLNMSAVLFLHFKETVNNVWQLQMKTSLILLYSCGGKIIFSAIFKSISNTMYNSTSLYFYTANANFIAATLL
ncbi:hypothetical protein [Ferruginibacter sp.]